MNTLLLVPVFVPLACAALGLLLADHRRAQRVLSAFAGFAAWLAAVSVFLTVLDGTPQTYTLGGWRPPFGIVFVADTLSSLLLLMSTTVFGLGVVYALGCKDKSVNASSFLPLFLCMGGALNGALVTGDIFTLFVFIELMVMSSVILTAASDNLLGLEAAIKYLLISAMGSLFLLVGIAAIYTTFGTLNMADIARLLADGDRPLLAREAAIMLMCAFLLKSAVFPFHFWQPDFHTTAPTPLSAMLSSIVVKVGVYGVIRMVTLWFTAEAPIIQTLLLLLGVIGIFFGSLSALRTIDAKRILAYSTLAQVGFILVGIGWGTDAALTAAIVFMFNHALIKAAMLMITGAVASRTTGKSSRLEELGGVGVGLPAHAGLYFVGALALAGIPPLNGFVSKVALAQSGIDAGAWVSFALVVGAGVLTLLYTTRTWSWIFQREPEANTRVKSTGDSLIAPAVLIGLCVLSGLFGSVLLTVAARAVERIGDPSIYIRAVLGG